MFLEINFSFMLATSMLTSQVASSGLSLVTQNHEPDGSRLTGQIPRFRATPEPPADLRSISHRQAMVDTEHYQYEAYAVLTEDPKASWIVRYIMIPEGNEGCREIEQVYLFAQDITKKPKSLKPDELLVESETITWKGKRYKLVDRRDLTTRP